MEAPETFGRRLRRLRQERGLTLREIECPGVSHTYIFRLERGDRTASVRAIRRLAAKLDVDPEYLETGVEPDHWAEARKLRAELDVEKATVEVLGKLYVQERDRADRLELKVAELLEAAADGDPGCVSAALQREIELLRSLRHGTKALQIA